MTHVCDGHAEAEVEIAPMHGNTIQSLHGGVAYALADTTTGLFTYFVLDKIGL